MLSKKTPRQTETQTVPEREPNDRGGEGGGS